MKENIFHIQLNDVVDVQCYKLNGNLYRQYNGLKIIETNQKYCLLFAWKTKVTKDKNRKWTITEPTFWFFPFSSKKFYNVLVSYHNNKFSYYVNMASPFVFEDGNFKYVDYDIDIKVSPSGGINIVDTHEFLKHSDEFKYRKTVKDSMFKSLIILIKEIVEKTDIFNSQTMKKYVAKFKHLFES